MIAARTNEERQLLTVEEAAKRVKLSIDCTRKKAKRGEIPAIRIGRQYRFYADELFTWIEAQRVKPLRLVSSQPETSSVNNSARTKKRDVRSLIIKHTARSGPGPS